MFTSLHAALPSKSSARSSKSQTRALFVFSDARQLPKDAPASLRGAIARASFKAELGECILGDDGAALIGLGAKASSTTASMRTAGARAGKALLRAGATSVTFDASIFDKSARANFARAFSEGFALGTWRFDQCDGTATTRTTRAAKLTLTSRDASFAEGLVQGLATADAVNLTRKLGATPPNICDPAFVAAEAKKVAKACGLHCRVIGFAEAKKLGLGGLCGVGQGSDAKPCLIVLEHKPKRASARAKGKTVMLVGKTITYDTGGYSLKVNNGMKGMKYDKMGGMAVLGAMQAIAQSEMPVHVVALLPAAENMVSSNAYRPDDIITLVNGVTVEVTNTDAEGRLVLADALAWGAKEFEPSLIIDLATLTGGVVTALGNFCAGYFCNDAKLTALIEESASRTGEKVWRLPLWQEHKDFMKSQHADILNSNLSRLAHPIQGAAFLAYFVPPTTPWCHLDIAGVAQTDTPTDLAATGPTGYGVRLLIDLVENLC
ncbi:MAG: leucyl aminopeptidase family protein [Phycisphaerales bacterium]|nr:leucyl aminopeptidase family protein [Phycisphaerales bacterium]